MLWVLQALTWIEAMNIFPVRLGKEKQIVVLPNTIHTSAVAVVQQIPLNSTIDVNKEQVAIKTLN